MLKSTLCNYSDAYTLVKGNIIVNNTELMVLLLQIILIKMKKTLEMHKDAQRTSRKKYYLPNVEIKDFSVMIDGKNFLINQ